MDLGVFRFRLKLRHAVSLVSASFLAVTAAVFVLRRVGLRAIPSTTVSDSIVAKVDHERCSCSCAENGDLFCDNTTSKTRRRFLSVLTAKNSSFNHSGCMTSLEVPFAMQGPTATVFNCSCHESSMEGDYLCRTTFAYENWYMQATLAMVVLQLLVIFGALFWNAYYVFVIHYLVLPSMPLDEIDQAWMQQWLARFWDPLHSVSLWIIWCLGVATLGHPARLHGPYPGLKDFDPIRQIGSGHTNSWLPQSLDESIFLCALGVFALTGFMMLCLVLAPALVQKEAQEDEKLKDQGRSVPDASSGKMQMCFVTSIILFAASTGLLVGPPVNFIYAIVITVPWWLLLAKQGSESSWPLDHAFPGLCSACWDLPPADWTKLKAAMRRLEFDEDPTLEPEDRTEKRSMPLARTATIKQCCRIAKEIQTAHPWRSVSELEKRLQTLISHGVETAIDRRCSETLKELIQAAYVLGYSPRRDEDEETNDVSTPRPKRGCCGRFFGYQKLGSEGGQYATTIRDEAWSDDIFQVLCAGLSSAINDARLEKDAISVRWMGVLYAIVYPKIALNLCGTIACAADALHRHIPEGESENHELFQLVAQAAGMHPDFEALHGSTAFGWALDLPVPQSRGTIPIMLSETESVTHDNLEVAELVVVEGNANFATIMGRRAFSLKSVTLGAPDLSVQDDGRWFFEIKIYGQALHYGVEFGPALECRVGLHLAGNETRSSNASGGILGLSTTTSCTLRSLLGSACGSGTVGCAMEKKENYCKIWFALDGAWSYSGTGFWDSEKPSTSCSFTSTRTYLYPAVSGRFVCEFAFLNSEFIHGPPEDSFKPLASSNFGEGVSSAPDRFPAAEVFGIGGLGDDDWP